MSERRAILVLGQKKAGTTSLHAVIAATDLPLLDLPKESGIMASPGLLRRALKKGSAEAVLLDATTTYFDAGSYPPEFSESLALFDRVTALYICRPETERLVSHFRHACNHDGWVGPVAEFVASSDYLHHAMLVPAVEAMRALGVDDIHVLPFDLLNTPGPLVETIARIVGRRPDLSQVVEENSFGSLMVMPGPVQGFLGTSLFQLLLRPLFPASLRQLIKRLIGTQARAVSMEGLDSAAVQELVARIDAENEALIARVGAARSVP
ncbi:MULTISPECIES: hypothetical protein [unclassified Marinovum]|uniref:hypothetical protein n=1 Tax=unclassified Marinovum TaxID=2647166 RepID=UPI003EDC7BC3